MEDLRQDSKYPKYMKALGWKTFNFVDNSLYVKELPLGFTISKLQRPSSLVKIEELTRVLKKYKIIYLLIEPKDKKQSDYYNSKGFRKTKSPSLPTKTIQFNLLKSERQLLSAMHHKARYNIGLSKRRGVIVKQSENVKQFSEFWHQASKSWGMRFSQEKEIISLYKSFRKESTILNAYSENSLIASVMLVSSKDTTYYMYAGSSENGNNLYAPSLLVWESILCAKKHGKKAFDFGGIYDERFPLKGWKGFTEFKGKFGGKVVEYPASLKKCFLCF